MGSSRSLPTEGRSTGITTETLAPLTTGGEGRAEHGGLLSMAAYDEEQPSHEGIIMTHRLGRPHFKHERSCALHIPAALALIGLLLGLGHGPTAAADERTCNATWCRGNVALADTLKLAQSEPPSQGVPPTSPGALTAPTPLDFPAPPTPTISVTAPADDGSPKGSGEQRTVFDHPRENGAIVDHCVTWATDCGQAGADQFCRTKRHERAVNFETYPAERTFVIGSRQICEGAHCMGFAQVVCTRPQSTVFDHPRENGAIIDHCVTWATDCGQAGADQFCRSKGHKRAVIFETYPAKRTYVIGSRQTCEGPHCVGFAKVVCAQEVNRSTVK